MVAVIQTEQTAFAPPLVQLLYRRFGMEGFTVQATADEIVTVWIGRERVIPVLQFLKRNIDFPFAMLYDLTAIDERARTHLDGQPASEFTVLYHLLSFGRNEDLRLKVALFEQDLCIPSITSLWSAANWYEREAWDMFGIHFDGHPNLRRIIMPSTWQGHPLRKDHPARATEMEPFSLPDEREEREQEALRFVPEKWGMQRQNVDSDFMFLNLGPNHPSVHGVFRVALQLDGEEIVDAVPDIGYHHRGAEKMGERQSWHTYIPYTDRVDYLGGSMNNLPYVMAVEKLAGIEVPERAQVIRVMISEFYRIASHLLFYGTFAQDVGQMSPIFYMFSDRELVFSILESITGARMHSSFFRIGGVAMDLPEGWYKLICEFIEYFPKRLQEYDRTVLQNRILKQRTQGIGAYSTAEAIEWGVSGAGLRATGFCWDYRKKRPYSGYQNFEFDIPVAQHGDCYDRCVVRVEEMRQSLRIIEQCMLQMPAGPFKARHPLTTPPSKQHATHDIETLIQHFLNVSWGPVIPPGEACFAIEATKGVNSYYLISDGGIQSYRTRIRTPSFPHLQMIPLMSRGMMVADLIAILASIDFVMADVDR
ncbi:NADH-quinone oxidoreductase subunit C/D [Candidatus Methylospira mobilis]|uniref:NADH-quinone oxidoreductase subunit C/D n=1 Tax=Candidatus Methylospira mobilis TaxID=1808979 RepID=A0A5Q0BEJ2_9GAMM|nr:NADH-quinone oxidoreductase subunit C/D [Candidatus Methylospira mobilis]QFY41929.1 NADH-quinone oxidoreductase subunit C/D [Candidatus Methylospira mobilis]WNV02917.1 NADH-quinone oxidoreductase subunit C/D [Candidatus Methylospira mobilis]